MNCKMLYRNDIEEYVNYEHIIEVSIIGVCNDVVYLTPTNDDLDELDVIQVLKEDYGFLQEVLCGY